MFVVKCDLCKKVIKGEPVHAKKGIGRSFELCEKCGQPIIKFLHKTELLPKFSKKQ